MIRYVAADSATAIVRVVLVMLWLCVIGSGTVVSATSAAGGKAALDRATRASP